MTKDDQIVELLTEIRDLEKEQMKTQRAARKAKTTSMVVRIILYAVVLTFAGGAAFYYYKTMLSAFS